MKCKRKKVNVTIAAILISIMLFCGCQPSNGPGQGPVTQNSTTPPSTQGTQETVSPTNSTAPTSGATPVKSSEPEQKPEILGEFTTKILDQKENRVNNIKLAGSYIMQKTLQKGETFSFNEVVGKRTPEKGYEKATVLLEKGEKGYEYGGGVCQLSSTLYNAALSAGMEITERHTHKDEVHYIELGKDAAVSYGSQDLKFVNSKGFAVKFNVSVNKNMTLTVKVIKAE